MDKALSTKILKADPAYLLVVNRLIGMFNPTQLAIYVIGVLADYNRGAATRVGISVDEVERHKRNHLSALVMLGALHRIEEEIDA